MRAILTYHSIDESGSPISIHPETFDRHIAWLRSGRVRVATIDELVAMPDSEDAVAITFDDGFANFLNIAAPRLLAHGLPVTLFIVSDRVSTTNAWNERVHPGIPLLPLLGWPALSRLRDQGVTLGAHSRTHADLTRLTTSMVEHEVLGSADAIEKETGARPSAFAYPYGRLNSSVCEVVAKVFRHGCTTEFATLEGGASPARLPRLDMYYFQDPRRLSRWGSPALARFIRLRHSLRRARQLARLW